MPEVSPEIAYYRAVEDLFGRLRGTPHTFSPKDFQLLRGWWREGVPLAAVVGGITEVFMNKKDRGDEDPVVSLSYCRHAVRRHATELREMRAGAAPAGMLGAPELRGQLDELAARMGEAAARAVGERPRVAAVIEGCRGELEAAAPADEAEAEALLLALETSLLEGCFDALDPEEREAIDATAQELAQASPDDVDARLRVVRAHRDRELRRRLSLPRLELA
jgi:hypothetical protein